MEKPPPLQLPSSENSSSLDLRLGPGVQTGLNLLQPPTTVQLEHLLVYRANQLFQELQCLAQSPCLLLAACRSRGHGHVSHRRSQVIKSQKLSNVKGYLWCCRGFVG